ncbi:MAG: 4-(cytidine 5'-diphospho)-2-C-methyl-D-erythritol kinase [Acidobacteria bacterium]|nr:4-(cytidine 5'-diphospho)-2-C-methyl-D-erythritol kinase [Acidobacteriota bacterium]MBI3655534.1 4-(cytidine 5'-diphospho)-2-C-methyl-D-erythritol kinase [Acidobacteriota bacterium]
MPLTTITVRSFAKINLGLEVLNRRPDGYHEIRTIFQTVSLHDTLHIRRAAVGDLNFTCEPPVLSDGPENLVLRAASLLREHFRPRWGATISLIKRIPIGAGLGGGSSNAAVTLLALNRLWHLNLPVSALQEPARALGADVPFFLWGGTAIGIGRGDEVYPCASVSPFHAVLIYPGTSVSTRAAYTGLGRRLSSAGDAISETRLPALCRQLADGEFEGLFNDFESTVLLQYPEVAHAHRFLKRSHAEAILLSGSGSTVVALYRDRHSALASYRAATDRSYSAFLVKPVSSRRYPQAIFPR